MEKENIGWTTFSTSFGVCGVTWNKEGITSFSLPEASERNLEKRLQKITGSMKKSIAPQRIKELVPKVKAHLKGQAQDFSGVPVHLDGASSFMRSVYEAAQRIPSGTVKTYGELAALIGKPDAVRAVGTALGKNPIPLIIPCHRIITSSGKLGGFSAFGGLTTKAALLELEGACLSKPQVIAVPAQWRKAVSVLKKQDRVLARLITQVGPIQFKPLMNKEPLAALIQAITSQQLSSKVADTILGRVNALIQVDGHPSAEKILNTPDLDLRKAGLSYMKASFLKDLAKRYLEGELSPLEKLKQMSNEQIIKEFTRIKGVGKWTVEMYLIFNLGRADIFPTLDFGIRKAIAQVYGLPKVPEPKAIEKYGELWKPYRTVASLYLWYSSDNT